MKKANNKNAEAYAKPHTMQGKPQTAKNIPPEAGGPERQVERDGIKMRGYGAATKGFMVRGGV